MAKDKERKTARILYVEQGRTAKDIAELVKVSEKTVSTWVNKYGWKSARTANFTDKAQRIDNIKAIINSIATDKMMLQKQLNALMPSQAKTEMKLNALNDELIMNKNNPERRKQILETIKQTKQDNPEYKEVEEIRKNLARLDDGAAKWTKTLKQIDTESRITLGTYLYVMDRIFTAMQNANPEMYMKTISFQEKHINDISIELG